MIYGSLKINRFVTILAMVFSDPDKAIFEHKKGFTSYRIWKDNPEKDWDKASVKQLIKRLIEYTIGGQKGFGRAQTTGTLESWESVENLVCSQEEKPWTHMHPRDIARELSIS